MVVAAISIACAAPDNAPVLPPDIASLEAKAASGDADAAVQVGKMYLEGKGVPKDPAKALSYLQRAADQGNAAAQAGLGYLFAKGIAVAKNDEMAREWFRKSAEQGYAKGELNYGQFLRAGLGGEKDSAKGIEWINKAVDAGDKDAVFTLAEIYFLGENDALPDYKKAFSYAIVSAEAGNAGAQNIVGVCYRDGLGVERDMAKAEQWFLKAAEQGEAKAQSNLGHLIGINSADPARRLQATKWLVKAATQGEPMAKRTLGEVNPQIASALLIKEKAKQNRNAASADGSDSH